VKSGRLDHHDQLVHELLDALKCEIQSIGLDQCMNSHVKSYILWPIIDINKRLRRGRPDIRFSNVVIEVEAPRRGVGPAKRNQLFGYMQQLAQLAPGSPIFGVVTDGAVAEWWELGGDQPTCRMSGDMSDVMRAMLHAFCSREIRVVTPDDLIEVFGI